MVEFEAPIGKQVHTPDGSLVKSRIINSPLDVRATLVGEHEGGHVYLAIERGVGVKRAKVNPDGTGVTETGGFDGVVFVGPSIEDPVGSGHDLRVAGLMGVNIEADRTVAKTMMSEGREKIHKAAVYLDQHGSATGPELEEAMNKGETVEKIVITPDGVVNRTVEEDVKGEVVMFPFQEHELPEAA